MITRRLMEHYHKVNLHESTETVLNQLRQRYMIKRCRATLNKMIRECQYCRVNRAKPTHPMMANHPEYRLATGARAFAATGIDYFGPIHVNLGRRKEKRWGVIFTCLVTRAVHLEVADNLENFINRRGKPAVIRSDNATNFVSTSKNYLDEQGHPLNWKFIPPAAPEQCGAWERLEL